MLKFLYTNFVFQLFVCLSYFWTRGVKTWKYCKTSDRKSFCYKKMWGPSKIIDFGHIFFLFFRSNEDHFEFLQLENCLVNDWTHYCIYLHISESRRETPWTWHEEVVHKARRSSTGIQYSVLIINHAQLIVTMKFINSDFCAIIIGTFHQIKLI